MYLITNEIKHKLYTYDLYNINNCDVQIWIQNLNFNIETISRSRDHLN